MADFQSFRSASSVVLGSLTGILIALPAALPLGAVGSAVVSIVAGAGGAAIGYRRRHSVGFFYFALICVLVLASLLSQSLNELSVRPPIESAK
jgi:hypothetical protein